jgi:hypothetical protein
VPVKDKIGKVVEGEAKKLLHWRKHFLTTNQNLAFSDCRCLFILTKMAPGNTNF